MLQGSPGSRNSGIRQGVPGRKKTLSTIDAESRLNSPGISRGKDNKCREYKVVSGTDQEIDYCLVARQFPAEGKPRIEMNDLPF
jgi:hypothetical protein